jgi:hypothetical protein
MFPVGREPPSDAELLTNNQVAEITRRRLRDLVDEVRAEQPAA